MAKAMPYPNDCKILARVEQVLEKGAFGEQIFAGPKGQIHSAIFTARLKSCPVTKPVEIEFFRNL